MSGGLNSNALSSQIKNNEWAEINNAIWMDGSIQMIYGFTRHSCQIGGSGSTTAITGIHDYQLRDGTHKYLVVVTEDDVYYYNTTTKKMTSIKGALAFTNYQQSIVTFNDRIVGTNGVEAEWTWNSAGNAVTLASLCGANLPPLTAKSIAVFNDRVVLMNYVDNLGNNYPARVAFCALDNVLSWNLTTQYWELETDDGQEIVTGRQLGEKFILYKRNSIGYVSGAFTDDWYVNRKWKTGVGCVSGQTVRTGYLTVNGQMFEVHIFLSLEGIRGIDEAGNIYQFPVPLQGEEYKVFEHFDALGKAGLYKAVGIPYRKRNHYLCFYYGTSSATNDTGSINDFNTNSFWPHSGIVANAAAQVYNTTTRDFDTYIGSEDGIVYQLTETTKGIESTTELVTNGSMEADSNWTSYGTPTTNDRSAAQVYQGTWARRFITDALSEGIYQDIITVVGQRYRVYAYTYATAGEVFVEKRDTDGTDIVIGSSNDAASWTRVEVTFTATATTSRIIFRNNTTAATTAYVDDVSARCIEVDSYGWSKHYDFGSEHEDKFLREFVPFAAATDTGGMTFTIEYNKGPVVSTTDILSLSSNALNWANDLNWDADISWDSYEEISGDLANLNFDRFKTMRYKFENNTGCSEYQYNKLFLDVISIGRRWIHAD